MDKRNKTTCIIQARLGSSRLPGKCLLKIKGKTVLSWVVRRVMAVNLFEPLIDKIVIATTTKEEDNLIEAWCIYHKIDCFRGSEKDVLSRYADCAKENNADYVLRITSDCPFIDPLLLYGLLKVPRKPYQALAVNSGGVVDGNDCELFSNELLQEINLKEKDKFKREHVGIAMRSQLEDLMDLGTPFNYKGIKLSLDTEEDFRRISQYAEYL